MFAECNLNLISKAISKPIHQEASYKAATFLTAIVLFRQPQTERISGGSSEFFVRAQGLI